METTINGTQYKLQRTDSGNYHIYILDSGTFGPLDNPNLYGMNIAAGWLLPVAEIAYDHATEQWKILGEDAPEKLREAEPELSSLIKAQTAKK